MKNENIEALQASTRAKVAQVFFDNEHSAQFSYESRIDLLKKIWDYTSFENNCDFSCVKIMLEDGTSVSGGWDFLFHAHFDHGDHKLTSSKLLNYVFNAKED